MESNKNKLTAKKLVDVLNPLDDAEDAFGTTFKLVISALTLVSALAWNDAIKGLFDVLKNDLYLKQIGFLAPFVYAILITLITVLIIKRLEKIQNELEKRKEQKQEKLIAKIDDKIAIKVENTMTKVK